MRTALGRWRQECHWGSLTRQSSQSVSSWSSEKPCLKKQGRVINKGININSCLSMQGHIHTCTYVHAKHPQAEESASCHRSVQTLVIKTQVQRLCMLPFTV